MSTIAEQLRDRTTWRYMGNCKCGKCQLVPKDLVGEAAAEIDRLTAVNAALLKAADDLLNDCINFNGGALSIVIMQSVSRVVGLAKQAAEDAASPEAAKQRSTSNPPSGDAVREALENLVNALDAQQDYNKGCFSLAVNYARTQGRLLLSPTPGEGRG